MIKFDGKTHDHLMRELQEALPDRNILPDDLTALAVALAKVTPASRPASFSSLNLAPYQAKLKAASTKLQLDSLTTADLVDPEKNEPKVSKLALPESGATSYYWCEASHTRHSPAGISKFVGKLPMARVTLPTSGTKSYSTLIGKITPSDHLIASVAGANAKYASSLSQPIGRLDVITPTRGLLRFGAVSVLLGYKNPTDTVPFCYILEAGMATGQPKVTYLGKSMGVLINQHSGYKPTPFSCPNNAYTGQLSMFKSKPNEPKNLTITSRKIKNGKSEQPYITISINFTKETSTVRFVPPALLLVRAAYIVWRRTGKIPEDCNITPPKPKA